MSADPALPVPTICLTPGDPTGIGPEITARFLARHRHTMPAVRFIVVGDMAALLREASALSLTLPGPSGVTFVDVSASSPGETAYQAIVQAVDLMRRGEATAWVTGPISKANLHAAGHRFQGHTELLETLVSAVPGSQPVHAEMLFVHRHLRLLLLTRHVPLAEVSTTLQQMNLRRPMETLCTALRRHYGIPHPRIAVLAVNPHAGEIGGSEETLLLAPLMARLNAEENAVFEGPFSADAFFRDLDSDRPTYDAVVAAYHDQGLIPFKRMAGFQAVNVTLGLPFIRTSVSHGTACEIAGQGIATDESMVAAVQEALHLAGKQQPRPIGR